MRAEKDFEDSQGGGSGYAEGDQNRGLAIRRAMERGGHEEQTIQDMLESLGYADPDPQPLAYGGRVGLREGGLSMMGQMDLLGNNQSRPMHLGMQNTPGFGGMGGGNNSPIFPRLDELQSGVSQAENSLQDINGRLGAPNGGSLSFLQAQGPGLQMNMSRIPEGLKMSPNRAVPAANGGIMSNQRGLVNQPGGYAGKSGIMGLAGPEVVDAMSKKIEEKTSSLSSLITDDEGDVYKPLQYLRKFGEDAFFGGQKNPELPEEFYNKLSDEYIQEMDKVKNKEPDFNDMPKVLENVKTAQVEEVSEIVELDDLSKIDSFAEMLSNIDESDPKYNEIRKYGNLKKLKWLEKNIK